METKMNLKKTGVALAAVAASAFVVSNLSGCATEMAAQNSTAATTQIQHSCKGMSADGEPMPYHKHHHHRHHHHHHQSDMKHHGSTKEAAPKRKAKRSACGVAGQ